MRTILTLFLTTLLTLTTTAADSPPPPGAQQLTENLLTRCAFLLTQSEKTKLDQAHRLYRTADSIIRNLKPANNPSQIAEATKRRNQAWTLTQQVLATSPAVIHVNIQNNKLTTPINTPVQFPSNNQAALLYHITRDTTTNTNNKTRCLQIHYPFIPEHLADEIHIPTQPQGTTYALLSMENLTQGASTFDIVFDSPSLPSVKTVIDWRPAKPGRLDLTVLSDDTSKPVPSMVQLRWLVDNRVYPTANSPDLVKRFDGRANPTNLRAAILPGPLRGDYAPTPGPVDMLLPPGDWQITVRRGVEHTPITETITIKPNQTTTRTYQPKRWVDMPKLGWYSADDHVHFQLTNSADADILMNWIRAEDIHLANIVRMGDITRGYFDQRGWGPDYRVKKDNHILSPGQEDPRTYELGHTLAMNTTALVRNPSRYYLYDEVFDAVHAQGGLTGYAHLHAGLFNVNRDMTLNIPRGKVDFAEIFQFGRLGLDLYYEFLNTGFKLTASTGSDVPWGGTVGEQRVYAYLGNQPFTADNWFAAFRKGHTFVTNGPMLNLTINNKLPGDTINITDNTPLHIKANFLGSNARFTPSKLEIIANGQVIKSIEQTAANQKTIALDFKIPPGPGAWIAARAEGSDGSRAHTTPIYIKRPKLRFWNYDQLETLLANRQESLNQIQALITNTPNAKGLGDFKSQQSMQQFLLQSAALQTRLNKARTYYTNLQKIRTNEAPIRKALNTKNQP